VTVTSQNALDGQAGEDFSALPMAARCGVDAIPFVVLVGKDGNVDSIHVRGPKLQARLTQLLGPPAAAEVPVDPTQPRAPGARSAGEPALRPATGDRGSSHRRGAVASPLAMLMVQSLFAADPAVEPKATPVGEETAINPYSAKPGLTPSQLIAYIEKMLDKAVDSSPRWFAAAIVAACDRVRSADPPAKAASYWPLRNEAATLHAKRATERRRRMSSSARSWSSSRTIRGRRSRAS
jgi:hypothetical protein